MGRLASAFALALSLTGAFGVAACQGCRTPPPAAPDDPKVPSTPTVRLYVLSTVAGALEPCGCTKNQLGGLDHFAAYVASQKSAAPSSLVVGAGPMLFLDPELKGDGATQATWKAEAIASAAKEVGLVAWAPGNNDYAGGKQELDRLAGVAGAKLLGGNIEGLASTVVREVGGVKVGLVGVADPKDKTGKYPAGVAPTAALEAMKKGVEEAKKQGARVLVGVASIPRGEALRLADAMPELNVLVLGKAFESGESNDAPKAPLVAGSTLVVEAANHLQTVSVVDLYVRDGKGEKLVFADAGGVAKADELLSLERRIRELEARVTEWEHDKHVKREDVEARKADLAKLVEQKKKLEEPPPAPPGSFFRYASVEVRDGLGSDKPVVDKMRDFYKRVNEHNKTAFADRKPPEPGKDEAFYVGIDTCTNCHDDARKFWDKTDHANAYVTLQKDFKEYNLDCVSCHVTGYGKPGGSTVTFNAKLQAVQCEVCHGPGSKHAKTSKPEDVLVRKPQPDSCVSACHHPPHVESFDAPARMRQIIGPGHGEKK